MMAIHIASESPNEAFEDARFCALHGLPCYGSLRAARQAGPVYRDHAVRADPTGQYKPP